MFTKLSGTAFFAAILQASSAAACIQALVCWAQHPDKPDVVYAASDFSENGQTFCGTTITNGAKFNRWPISIIPITDEKFVYPQWPACTTDLWSAAYMIGVFDKYNGYYADVVINMPAPDSKAIRGQIRPTWEKKISGLMMKCGAFKSDEGAGGQCASEARADMGFIGDWEKYYAAGGVDGIHTEMVTVTMSNEPNMPIATSTRYVGFEIM